MYLINSIPIPEQNMRIQFFIPYCNNPKIELQCPKLNDISIMNSNFMGLFKNTTKSNDLIKVLSKYDIEKIYIEQASIEDIFLHYYE